MTPQIALQMYTLRTLYPKDFEGVMRKVAEIGYAGIETTDFKEYTPQDAAKLFKALGLAVVGLHSALPLGKDKKPVLDSLALFETKYLVATGIRPADVKDMASIQELCERLNRAQAVLHEAGATLVVHNHWWEYEKLNGELVADLMLARLDPAITFELDTYWIKVGGEDPAEIVRKRGKRAPLLHIKDGPGNREQPMTAIGDGIIDFPSIYRAGGNHTLWWIYEADRLAGDIFTAVQKSYTYMKGLLK